MKEWLEAMVSELSNVQSSLSKFISAVSLACCVVECPIQQNLKMEKFVIPLLRLLNPQPDIRRRIHVLMEITSTALRYDRYMNISMLYMLIYRSTASRAVERLFKETINSNVNKPIWDLLNAIPLYHFMGGKCKPFMKPELNPEHIQFNTRDDVDLELKKLKTKVHVGYVDAIQR